MDEAKLRAAEEDLVAWGLLEPGPAGPALSRRFRGALARAAMALQAEAPGGHPVARAIERALADAPLPEGARPEEAHRALLVAVEVASLPPAVRDALGV